MGKNFTSCSPMSRMDRADAGQRDEDVPAHADKPVVGTEYKITCDRNHNPSYFVTRYYQGDNGKQYGVEVKIPPSVIGPMAKFFQSAPPTTTKARGIQDRGSIDPKVLHIAKVLYAETGGKQVNAKTSNPREKYKAQYAVASVIQNRINKKNFGNPASAYKACDERSEFSCIRSRINKHWRNAGREDIMNQEQTETWKECLKIASQLQTGSFQPIDETIVYFHASSIETPTNWFNKYYTAVFVMELGGHKFFKVEKTISATPQNGIAKE